MWTEKRYDRKSAKKQNSLTADLAARVARMSISGIPR